MPCHWSKSLLIFPENFALEEELPCRGVRQRIPKGFPVSVFLWFSDKESLRVRTFAVESLSANPMEGKGREEDLKLDSGGASPTFALAVGLQSRGFLEKPVQQPEMSFCCQNTFERRACLAESTERI